MTEFFAHAESWLIITFAIFAVLMWKMGRVSALYQLDSYIDTIKGRINEATALREKASKMAADYEARQKNALAEAQSIVDEAAKETAAILASGERDLKARMESRQKQFDAEMAHIEASALAELKAKMAALVEAQAREQLMARLNGDAQTSLIEQSIETARAASKAA